MHNGPGLDRLGERSACEARHYNKKYMFHAAFSYTTLPGNKTLRDQGPSHRQGTNNH